MSSEFDKCDEARINVLYSPFRPREANPVDWKSKLEFWETEIRNWCLQNKRVSFSVDELKNAFIRNGRFPMGMETVVDELLRSKTITRANEYGSLSDNNGWVSWGMNILVKRPLSWSMSTLAAHTVGKKENPYEKYIITDVVKEKAKEIITAHQSHVEFESTDHVLELATLREQCRNVLHSEVDLENVLVYLRKERLISTYVDSQKSVVKFKYSNEKAVNEISEVDLGILRLKKAKEVLEMRVVKLQEDADECIQDVRQYLREGNRALAKVALRKKKLIEKAIVKREDSLQNLDSLLSQIQEVDTEKLVIDAYRTGVSSLRRTLKQGKLSLDDVDNTMASIQEVFDMHEDIQEAVSQPLGGDGDATDLESELEDLLASSEPPPPTPPVDPGRKAKVDEFDDLDQRLRKLRGDAHLPDVPMFQPGERSEKNKVAQASNITLRN